MKKFKIFQNLYYESYRHQYNYRGFYVGVMKDGRCHNLHGFRLNDIITEFDLDEVKKTIKNSIKHYKKKHNVLVIFGYKELIKCIIEDFSEDLNEKSLRKEKLKKLNG